LNFNRLNGQWFPNDDWAGVIACEETTHSDVGPGGKCGRPVVGEGEGYWSNKGLVPLCSLHMGVHKRKQANAAVRAAEAARRQEKRDERGRERKVAEDAVARLLGWGIKAEVGVGEDTRRFNPAINGEVAVALVERFELLCRETGIDFDEEIEDLTKGGRA
jgi:hypothetical protein